MITWRSGVVSCLRREWNGAVEIEATVDGVPVRALAYPQLTGRPEPGDRALLNTGALDMGLGTGGYALVIALPDRLPPVPSPMSSAPVLSSARSPGSGRPVSCG